MLLSSSITAAIISKAYSTAVGVVSRLNFGSGAITASGIPFELLL